MLSFRRSQALGMSEHENSKFARIQIEGTDLVNSHPKIMMLSITIVRFIAEKRAKEEFIVNSLRLAFTTGCTTLNTALL